MTFLSIFVISCLILCSFVGSTPSLMREKTPPINSFHEKEHKDICLTPECNHTASQVLSNMDQIIDPCDDFYKFACGNFIKKTNIPDDKPSVSSSSIINDKVQEQLRTMVEEASTPNEPKPFRLLKKLYKACMNTTNIEKEGLQGIHKILKDLGGWPVLEGELWRDGDFSWREAVYKFRKGGYAVDYFIGFSVTTNDKNSTEHVIKIEQASLALEREFLVKGMKERIVKAYYKYMVDIAVIFGADRKKAKTELKESLKFEIKLANISLTSEKQKDSPALYNPMTISELQKNFSTIPWREYIGTILEPDVPLKDNEVVIVSVPKYLTEFEKLISETPKRVQANYILWRAAASSVTYLTDELRRRQLQYFTIMNGGTKWESRWKECVNIASRPEHLAIAAGALYERKYFNEAAKHNVQDMVRDIRLEFDDILKGVEWMDEETKKNALEKSKSMTIHIGYPNELLDDSKLEDFYKDLELDESNYLGSILNLTLFGTSLSFKRLRQPVNKMGWIFHENPAIVNPFYNVMENNIKFPASSLQGVFFNADRPRYMNYGAIGFMIGHEITHGFDDQGRQYDKNGNLVDWWQNKSKKIFLEKAQCIIEQYGNYSVPELGINLNGINTQRENIADNGGIKESYLAYNAWTKRNGDEARLPGLDFNNNQMFWISAGQVHCSKYRKESLKILIRAGYYSPGPFRVNGPMMNLDQFAQDFNCPKGTKMNPKKKCHVW